MKSHLCRDSFPYVCKYSHPMVLGPVHWSRLDLPRFCFEKNELLRVPGPVALEKRPPLPTSKLLSSDRAIGFFAEAVPANDGMNRILVYYVQHKSIYIYITVCTDSTDAKNNERELLKFQGFHCQTQKSNATSDESLITKLQGMVHFCDLRSLVENTRATTRRLTYI